MESEAVERLDLLSDAAELTFAMLRFEQGAAADAFSKEPLPQGGLVGVDVFAFAPLSRVIRREEVVPYLVSLGTPAILACTTTRGAFALALLSELTGARRASAEHTLRNQEAFLKHFTSTLDLKAADRILLEFEDEVFTISAEAMTVWAKWFAVQTSWSITKLEYDHRWAARLNLRRSDGGRSWGGWCPWP